VHCIEKRRNGPSCLVLNRNGIAWTKMGEKLQEVIKESRVLPHTPAKYHNSIQV